MNQQDIEKTIRGVRTAIAAVFGIPVVVVGKQGRKRRGSRTHPALPAALACEVHYYRDVHGAVLADIAAATGTSVTTVWKRAVHADSLLAKCPEFPKQYKRVKALVQHAASLNGTGLQPVLRIVEACNEGRNEADRLSTNEALALCLSLVTKHQTPEPEKH